MRIILIALTVSVSFAQTNQVFQLTQNQTKQALQEIAVVLRGTGDIQQVSIDDLKGTLAVEGTPAQIATAAWLIHQMDLPANGPLSGVHEYRPPAAGNNDVVRVFYLSHVLKPQDIQEIVTAVRSVADIQRLRVYNALNAVAARGTNQQISLAAWMVDQLDQPANVAAPAPHEYQLSGDDVARVFELTYPQTPQQLQEVVTLIRSIGDIRRLFFYYKQRAVVLRATAERVALAAWLVSELDKPLTGPVALQDSTAPHEFRLSNDPDNLVRVFYLAGSASSGDYQKVALQVRHNTGIGRLFVYNALGALAVRGTEGQVATAEKALEELKSQ
jgi:type II secretory pathway component GspD/PulD (secretin)